MASSLIGLERRCPGRAMAQIEVKVALNRRTLPSERFIT
jgi:hypothetical protein